MKNVIICHYIICHTFERQCVTFSIFFSFKVIKCFNNKWGGFLQCVAPLVVLKQQNTTLNYDEQQESQQFLKTSVCDKDMIFSLHGVKKRKSLKTFVFYSYMIYTFQNADSTYKQTKKFKK